MATIIDDNLSKILSARYGEEVRGAIHDAIEQCYNNVDSDLNMKSNGIKIVRDAESGFDANDLPDNSFTDFIITQSGYFSKRSPRSWFNLSGTHAWRANHIAVLWCGFYIFQIWPSLRLRPD